MGKIDKVGGLFSGHISSLFFSLFKIKIMKALMRTCLVLIIALVFGVSIYFIVPHLKPKNDAFAPQTPSSSVSPRLKGIFKGMGDGFSR